MTSPLESTAGDRALLGAWIERGDQESFQALCHRHAGLVVDTCRRLRSPDADEAAQAVFITLARKPRSVAQPERLAGWLLGTARRVVAHQHRASARRQRHEQEAAMEAARNQASRPTDWSEARPLLDDALARLSPARREAVARFYLEGKPQAVVAAELGCSVDAVKNRIHEGLAQLRAAFAKRGVALGAAALASGLASEAAASDPAVTLACCQGALAPAGPPAALAHGVQTAMYLKSATIAASACVLLGTLVTTTLMLGAEAPPKPLAVVAAPPVAAGAPVLDPAANAALDWWRAIAVLPKDSDPIWKKEEARRTQQRVACTEAELALLRTPLELLALGAANTYCDWGVDLRGEAYNASLPHLGGFRKLIRLGLLRSQVRGPSEGAAAVDDLVLCLRSTRLCSTGSGLIISFLVAMSMESDCLATAARIAPGLPAAERQRLAAALDRLPMLEAATALRGELEFIAGSITEMRSRPLLERAKFLSGSGSGDSVLKRVQETVINRSDDAIDRSLRQLAEIAPRLDTYLRQPLAGRLMPFKPVFQGGAEMMTPMLNDLFPKLDSITKSEIRLATTRQQLVAALAFLDRGEAGLAAHPDPFTGKPFTLVQDGAFRRLVATSPALGNPLDLWIGPRPPDGATSPAAADEPNQDAEPNSRF